MKDLKQVIICEHCNALTSVTAYAGHLEKGFDVTTVKCPKCHERSDKGGIDE